MKSISRCWNVQQWSGPDLVEWSGMFFRVLGESEAESGSVLVLACVAVSIRLSLSYWGRSSDTADVGFLRGLFTRVTHMTLLYFLTTSSLVTLFILLLTVLCELFVVCLFEGKSFFIATWDFKCLEGRTLAFLVVLCAMGLQGQITASKLSLKSNIYVSPSFSCSATEWQRNCNGNNLYNLETIYLFIHLHAFMLLKVPYSIRLYANKKELQWTSWLFLLIYLANNLFFTCDIGSVYSQPITQAQPSVSK